MHACADVLGEPGSRCFFNHFLVPALGGTVSLAEGQNLAFAIAKQLHFHMAGMFHKFFQEHAVVAEVVLAQALDRLEALAQIVRAIAAGHANAATAGGAFEHHRVADGVGGFQCFFQIGQQASAREQWHTGAFRQ